MIKSILGGKSKNLFDISNAQIINGYISERNVFSRSSEDKTIIIPCLPNTTYTFSKSSVSPRVHDRLRIGDYASIPVIGDTINNVVNIGEPPTHNYITITTSDNAKYMVITIGLFKPTVITSLDYILNTCQLEKGSTATEYVPHELTSYKSIMKVRGGHFVTSYDERMPCKTKNLFSSSTEVGIPSSTKFDKSEKRLLEDGKCYIGLAGSNYYSQNFVLDYSIMENSVYVKWKINGYAVAKCIYCEPNTTYSFTKKYSLIQGHSLETSVGFYTEDGTFISCIGEKASPRFVFNTPENCKYITICMAGVKFPNDNFGAGCFSDLQLVKGTTATDYVPYGYV